MEENFERDKRKGKAKVEETGEVSLPPKINSNTDAKQYYVKLCGPLRTQDVVGPPALEGVIRNVFRVRNKDILGIEDVKLQGIQTSSGATIGIYSDPEVRIHHHTNLELLGTVNEVKIAIMLIEDAIKETYQLYVPTPLMPTSVCYHRIPVPISKVSHLLGFFGNNLVIWEAQFGAWIELDTIELPSAGEPSVREVIVCDSPPQVANAVYMITIVLSEEPGIPEDIDLWDDITPEDILYWDTIPDGFTSIEQAEHQESAKLEDEKEQHACVNETAHNDSVKEAAVPRITNLIK